MTEEEVDEVDCPMCNHNRGCTECAGLGAVPCDACGGKGGDCAKCNRVGQYECTPCNGSGVCPVVRVMAR